GSVDSIVKVCGKYAPILVVINTFMNVTTFGLPFEGIMFYGAYRAMVSHTISLAELAIMFNAMVTCSWILIGLFNNINEAQKNGLFLEYFRTFMEYKEKIPEDSDGIIPERRVESIEFRNVSFEYTKDEQVIKNLSFTLDQGKIIALVGHNGAGKTTIIKLLFRLYDPTEGEILVNGINIKEYNLKAYRNLFVAAFQDYKVMSMSVRDNVLMGVQTGNDKGKEDKMVASVLKQAGIWDKVQSLPEGIDTVLTKEFDPDGAILSGGETQKIVVARAFAQKVPVKVFDEPSSALDPIAEYHLYKGIMKESKNKDHDLTLFITHRLSSVKDADIILMLEEGAVIEQGTHKELMDAKGKYSSMFTMQAQNYLAIEEYKEEEAV
ncbi:MAG: ABC transporter ATP-binding protein/permease, partial [Lachnoclostridium sp.]|nr:ABC transporter ATP-binding protein/permease [Lachnoclostridium sp.]